MKKILLVDDDNFILRVFRDGLVRHGFQVQTANDGLEGVKALQESRPDVVVLDLMMPKFTGVDVVKFIRGRSDLADLPVIVLSNSYIDELAQAVHEAGIQEALLKSRCTPLELVEVIRQNLDSGASNNAEMPSADPDFQAKARHEFFANGAQTCVALRELLGFVKASATDQERNPRLLELYRKAHFVAATAGLAACPRIEKLSSAFEALLFVLVDKPANFSVSISRTLDKSIDLFETLFQEPPESALDSEADPSVMVVDDDAVSNRLATGTLRSIGMIATGFQDPIEALRELVTAHYDLILLDIEMPSLDGFEFCRRTRGLPAYRKTPIVYVTSHADFQSHAEGLLSGGTDLIAKPVFPMELALKTVIHLLDRS